MAGANGILKFARTDREGYLDPLLYRGTAFQMVDPLPIGILASPIPNPSVLSDILLLVGGPPAITVLGTAADIGGLLAVNSLNQVGSKWSIVIQNADPVTPVVITLPAGFNPASITVPANGYYQYTWEVLSTVPESIQLVVELPGTGGGAPVTTFNGRPGPVILPAAGDYTSTMITNLSTVPGADVTTALNNLAAGSGVSSFNARTGAVVPVAGDYNSTQITNSSTVPGATVTVALDNAYNIAPTGKLLLTDTNVDLAIARLALDPISLSVGVAFPVPNVPGAWVQIPQLISPSVRGAFIQSPIAPVTGIQDNNPVDAGNTLATSVYGIANTFAPVVAGAGQIGIRILRNFTVAPFSAVVAENIVENDQSGAIQLVTVSGTFASNPGDIYTLEVINNLGLAIQAEANLTVRSLGQIP